MKRLILFLFAVILSLSVYSGNNLSGNYFQNKFDDDVKHKTAEVKIYPNPCKNGRVNIEFKSHLISDIQLTNITGKVVYRKHFDYAEMKKQLQLNDIRNGMYLLKVKSTDNKTVVKKFIVSR